MDRIRTLKVKMHGETVGTMALYQNRLAAFEYDDQWLIEGYSISPFSLPLVKKVFVPEIDPFEGLFGVFADSLPDGWGGRLLVDRQLATKNVDSRTIMAMDRLSIVGDSGMGGALTYEPISTVVNEQVSTFDYDTIASECKQLLENNETEDLDRLMLLGGSSGGARPKILTKVDGEDWIIKFASSIDDADIGIMEYKYSECAKACGILMEETQLFESKLCPGYFGTKRFDRLSGVNGKNKVHMMSVSALLEVTHRIPPNLDYHTLMKLTLELTKDYSEVDKMYRLMCFNVFAHNRDDHSKNFSYLYNHQTKSWHLSPAYDLTYSHSIGGEHATTINGNGRTPTIKDIIKVGTDIGIKEGRALVVAKEIEAIVYDMLRDWLVDSYE